jgi:hypothetical protein
LPGAGDPEGTDDVQQRPTRTPVSLCRLVALDGSATFTCLTGRPDRAGPAPPVVLASETPENPATAKSRH